MSESQAENLVLLEKELVQLEKSVARLEGERNALLREELRLKNHLQELESFLALVPDAELKLEELSRQLFEDLLQEIETNLTYALREILGQDRQVSAVRSHSRGKLELNFQILNNGAEEEVPRAQGGSVLNILATGLRLIALASISATGVSAREVRSEEKEHRPFLVLDEADCWIRPEIVPEFVRVVAKAADRLGLQVLYISHHPVELFAEHAQRIFELLPDRKLGIKTSIVK